MSDFSERMDAIGEALTSFEQVLTPRRPIDMVTFVQERVKLSRAVNDFVAAEWASLPQTLSEEHGSLSAPVRSKLHRQFTELRAVYSAHISRWDSRSIVADWPGYRYDCEGLVAGLRGLLKARLAMA